MACRDTPHTLELMMTLGLMMMMKWQLMQAASPTQQTVIRLLLSQSMMVEHRRPSRRSHCHCSHFHHRELQTVEVEGR